MFTAVIGRVLLITINLYPLILDNKLEVTFSIWDKSISPFVFVGVPTDTIISSEFLIAFTVSVVKEILFFELQCFKSESKLSS